ncbi:indolethylamine N-methyltransferase-like [Bombina bombina]|uniref:indolethylamine N-methyltransferase-like n=1 Tax=Bombina bombina TaxID=8345 RepID=UPI00235ADC7C|nr:indolethylamine N-methyltransferase-like [Bombina bombina]
MKGDKSAVYRGPDDLEQFCETLKVRITPPKEQLPLDRNTPMDNHARKSCIKGQHLICMKIGSIVYPLIPLSEFFNDITMLEFNDICIKELEKWINTHDAAHDWSHMFNEEWKKREEKVKTLIKRILKYDLTKENPTDPVVLPKVDCIFIGCCLEIISKTHDDVLTMLKRISGWLKPGGHLIMYVLFNATYFTVGEHHFHVLKLDEAFVSKALRDIGYKIETMDLEERKSNHGAASYDHFALIIAVMQ